MKKLLLAIVMMLSLAGITTAQTKPAADKQEKKTAVKPAEKPAHNRTAVPLKKDGTPDKRFKANKETEGPKKKDGTPDKRYKANQNKKN